jgi:hypothetical protein
LHLVLYWQDVSEVAGQRNSIPETIAATTSLAIQEVIWITPLSFVMVVPLAHSSF